mgnify:CR=1 FL=1
MLLRKLKTATQINRVFLERFCFPGMRAIDATLGKGNDTLMLLELGHPDGKVYGFDIQEEAIRLTESKLAHLDRNRYELFHTGHEHIVDKVLESVDLAIFNLGYLPTGDKGITTMTETTTCGIGQAFDRLKVGGLLIVTVYPGHEEGAREASAIGVWLSGQPQQVADVLHFQFVNHQNAPPQTYILEKRSESALLPIAYKEEGQNENLGH